MHSIQRINQALAQLVASLNVVAAVLIVLMTAAGGYTWAGIVGIIVGVRGGPRFSDRLLRWSPDPTGGIWNATQETELPG